MRPKSSKPRKQRKFLHEAPLHLRRKMMAAHLSKELRGKYRRRSLPVRINDEVEVMRGKFRGKKGKISRLNLKKYRVYIEGLSRKKVEGTDRMVPIHPSNLRLTTLVLADKERIAVLGRKVKTGDIVGSQKAEGA